MKRRALLESLPAAALFSATDWLSCTQQKTAQGPASTTVYELRVYHTFEGKLDDLLRRFREHTMRLFERHGIRNVAYWRPVGEPLKDRTLFYISAPKPGGRYRQLERLPRGSRMASRAKDLRSQWQTR